jgi:HSP20 family protein
MMWKNIYRVSGRPANARRYDMWRMNRQMDHLLGGTRGPICRDYPSLQAWSGDEGLIIVATMPGVDEDALEITVDGRTLTLSGSRLAEDLPDSARTYRQERASGEFNRQVELPYDVDVDAVKASYEDGLLQIELPRVAEDLPRKITVNGS